MASPVMVSAIYQVFNLIMEFDTADHTYWFYRHFVLNCTNDRREYGPARATG